MSGEHERGESGDGSDGDGDDDGPEQCGRGGARDRPQADVRQRRCCCRGAARRRRDIPARAVRRRHGTVRIGQVDTHAPARRPRRSHSRHGRDRRARHHGHGRCRADATAPRPHRLRLPVLQPAADADGRAERRAAAQARRALGRGGLGHTPARERRSRRAQPSPAVRALRRTAAARRRRPRARQQARSGVRRRADRQPRLQDERRDPRADATVDRGVRPDDRDRDP